ncbi:MULTISPECIES: low affinity iron permease family protein [Mesorhizobium]|uniref:low affinity iron permease family protein n=1 Tax=Mesorhizobium TaxID=68287 RepID=UPI0010A95D7C|nr:MULTISPECIES: low affinity iron permease family protein [Mesorhizobium]
MNRFLFLAADFLSRPPGFYVLVVAMVLCTLLVPFGLTNAVTYALSVAAIIITGVVLIQGYRDTAAIHAKLDELIIALAETRNDVVGLEHADPHEIKSKLTQLEQEAQSDLMHPSRTSREEVAEIDADNSDGT